MWHYYLISLPYNPEYWNKVNFNYFSFSGNLLLLICILTGKVPSINLLMFWPILSEVRKILEYFRNYREFFIRRMWNTSSMEKLLTFSFGFFLKPKIAEDFCIYELNTNNTMHCKIERHWKWLNSLVNKMIFFFTWLFISALRHFVMYHIL